MQLLVLALMLMMSGKNANLKELKPIFEELGGDGAAEAFKQAEELSDVISAVQSLAGGATSAGSATTASGATADCGAHSEGGADGKVGEEEWKSGGYPLAPIAGIADERITYCLSRYIACGE